MLRLSSVVATLTLALAVASSPSLASSPGEPGIVLGGSGQSTFVALENAQPPTLGESDQDSLALIGQPETLAGGFDGDGVAVAVFDGGVDHTNPAFGSCKVPGPDCGVVATYDAAADGTGADNLNHGTHVAGIVSSVAPSSKIISVDVMPAKGKAKARSPHEALVAGIEWAIDNKEKYNIRVINMSLWIGTESRYSETCEDLVSENVSEAVDLALSADILTVTISGNGAFVDGRYRSGVSFPGCLPNVITVGSVYDGNIGSSQSRV